MSKGVPVPSKPDKLRVEEGDWELGYSNFICPHCGYYYSEHVKVPGYWHLRRLCDGTLVKLIG